MLNYHAQIFLPRVGMAIRKRQILRINMNNVMTAIKKIMMVVQINVSIQPTLRALEIPLTMIPILTSEKVLTQKVHVTVAWLNVGPIVSIHVKQVFQVCKASMTRPGAVP